MIPIICHPKVHNANKLKKLQRLSCPVESQKLLKLFIDRVKKLFGSIVKLQGCLKMSTIHFSRCPFRNIDIATLLGHSKYQIIRHFAKCFIFTESMSWFKYLYSKGRIKHFWANAISKMWHFNCWKWEISFYYKSEYQMFYFQLWFPNQERIPHNNLYFLFWVQARDSKSL